jgi:hypothetical protein
MRVSCADNNFTYFRFEIDPNILSNVNENIRKELVKYEYFYDGGDQVVKKSSESAQKLCKENPKYRFCKYTCENTSRSDNCREASISIAMENNWDSDKHIKIYKDNKFNPSVKSSIENTCNRIPVEEWSDKICKVYSNDNPDWKDQKMWGYCSKDNNLLFNRDCDVYCKKNPDKCQSILRDTCNNFIPSIDENGKYDIPELNNKKLMKFTNNGIQIHDGTTLSNNVVNMCGCFYNTRSENNNYEKARDFYKKDLIDTYKGDPNVISAFNKSGNPIKCFTKVCKDSSIRNVYGQCQGTTCIQNLKLDSRNSQLTGVEIQQIQQCGIDTDTQPPSDNPNEWNFKFD